LTQGTRLRHKLGGRCIVWRYSTSHLLNMLLLTVFDEGGLQAGSSDYGLGSGFTMTPESITIGAGIGLNTANVSANIQFTGAKNGSVELVFESSAPIVCTPGVMDGISIVSCRTL
jgi:hypothetical protein